VSNTQSRDPGDDAASEDLPTLKRHGSFLDRRSVAVRRIRQELAG
jgi:hypothetical protein